MDEFLFSILMLFLLAFLLFVLALGLEEDANQNIEIIKKQQDFNIYKNCEYLDGFYYCYDEVKK